MPHTCTKLGMHVTTKPCTLQLFNSSSIFHMCMRQKQNNMQLCNSSFIFIKKWIWNQLSYEINRCFPKSIAFSRPSSLHSYMSSCQTFFKPCPETQLMLAVEERKPSFSKDIECENFKIRVHLTCYRVIFKWTATPLCKTYLFEIN